MRVYDHIQYGEERDVEVTSDGLYLTHISLNNTTVYPVHKGKLLTLRSYHAIAMPAHMAMNLGLLTIAEKPDVLSIDEVKEFVKFALAERVLHWTKSIDVLLKEWRGK